jgi:hypothetical protein
MTVQVHLSKAMQCKRWGRVVSGRVRPRGREKTKEGKDLWRQDKEGLKYIKYNKSRGVRNKSEEHEGERECPNQCQPRMHMVPPYA